MKFELQLRKRNNSKDDLIADLQKIASEIEQSTLTASVYAEKGRYGVNTMLRRFGSWNNALKAAGLKLSNRLNIPDEELFENLAYVWQTLGRQPVGKDVEKSRGLSKFSLGTYEKRFGTWNKALEGFINYINKDETAERTLAEPAKTKSSQRRTTKKINWRLRHMILVRDNCICQMCGTSPAKDPDTELHVDHIIPWTKGGETLSENLRTLCSKCNIGKSDLLIE